MLGNVSAQGYDLLSVMRGTDKQIANVEDQLASGIKNLSAAEEGQSTRLNSKVSSFEKIKNNISSGENLLDVTKTGLDQISDLLTEMKDIAVEASNGTKSSTDLASLQETFSALRSQIDEQTNAAEMDGINLIKTGATDVTIQVGDKSTSTFTLSAQSSSAADLSIDSLDVSTQAGAQAAMDALTTAIDTVSSSRASVTAMNRSLEVRGNTVDSVISNLKDAVENMTSADREALSNELKELQEDKNVQLYTLGVVNQETTNITRLLR